uniref:Uncharacterized LOC103375798 n=1 Tax=Stegastes partitus TaxID=144197 RepID=A0A3B4ZP67_9TELE
PDFYGLLDPAFTLTDRLPGHTGDCLHELERINKQIETVRHEVEQEQRRLSRYQTVQADGRNLQVQTAGTDVDRGPNGPPSCTDFTKTHVEARKYVVDNSKPRTDLEYDPLSNFSADLRTYSSSGKDQKNQKGLKKARTAVSCDQMEPTTYQTLLSRSPELHDDSNEDSVLIIDVPPSPVEKRGQTQKAAACVAGRSSQAAVGEGMEAHTLPILPDTSLKVTSSSASRADANKVHNYCDVGNNSDRPTFNDKGCEKTPVGGSAVDLTGCLEDLDSECQKITGFQSTELLEKTHQAATSDRQDLSWNNLVCELPNSAEKLQPPENSLFYRAPAGKSWCMQHTKEAQATAQQAPSRAHSQLPPEQPSVVTGSQRTSGQMQSEAALNNMSSVGYEDQAESPSGSRTRVTDGGESSYEPTEQRLVGAGGDEVIIISSDDEAGALNYSEMELSDSDPMEECYRIFMEANNEDRGTEHQPDVSVSLLWTLKISCDLFVSLPECIISACTFLSHPAGYLNYVPLGTAVIEVGNNLHLILPEGAFPLPVTSSPSPPTTVLTPVSRVHPSAFTVKQTYHPPAATPVQRYHSTAPVLIPAPARKPSLTPAFASASLHLSPPTPAKRKLKQQCEATKDKVPHDVRQRYVNMFTEEFLKTAASVKDAFEKALAEERTVYNRSVNKLKYLSIAVNALKKLKNQSAAAAAKSESQILKGNIPLTLQKLQAHDDLAFYESLKDYLLTDEKLIESNCPVQHPERRGCAVLFTDNKRVHADPLKRICCRCGATYSVSPTGKHIRKEECNYHYGKAVTKRVPGGVETRYSCCEGVMGTPGCHTFKLHVHDSLSLDGFVSTGSRRPPDTSCPGVYSLDCEMCYTIHGLELSRVTVVNSSLQVVYDTFVRPDNEVIDYNTRFSGISEEDVKGTHTSLREVQETLLSFISADTVLIGHGLETDLCLLKLLHGTVVDTSMVFPHRLGPPHKLTLNNLTAEHLRRIIQEIVCGHDTAEDAAACMELMLWKVKEDGKLKK